MINKLFIILHIIKWSVLMWILISIILVINLFSFYGDVATNKADCIVVFGAAVWPGYYGPQPSHALSDRTVTAGNLYKAGLSKCIILSGANSIYGAHEVDMMTDILITEGISEKDIILDRAGTNTLATIRHLDNDKSYILVSNDFHLARIGMLAKRYDLDKEGFKLHKAKYGIGSGLDGTVARYSREPFFILREIGAYEYYFITTFFD